MPDAECESAAGISRKHYEPEVRCASFPAFGTKKDIFAASASSSVEVCVSALLAAVALSRALLPGFFTDCKPAIVRSVLKAWRMSRK